MSRTDHHNPDWVRALHAHHDGLRTYLAHSAHCEDYDGPLRIRDHIVRKVDRVEAESHGWESAPRWSEFDTTERVYVRVPHGPFACDADSAGGRCRRYLRDRDRWYCYAPPDHATLHGNYFGPERAAVRDALREVVKEYRGRSSTPFHDGLDDWEPRTDVPIRQARSSTWAGGWWD